jgi:mannose-6-phosphate isomerase
MFVGITNTPRDYAWGSRTAIAELFGYPPPGAREAELWLGTHPGSPARLTAGSGTLAELTTLPFLLKVLAAQTPLSLQAHPTTAQAIAGFDRENAAGIPLDAPSRNYKDASHKPELIFALQDGFRALCGFRPVEQTRAVLSRLGSVASPLLDRLPDDSALSSAFEWLISGGPAVSSLVSAVSAGAASVPGIEFETVRVLAAAYPGDPGIVISLLLNVVELRRGEVLYLPAGNIHAYLNGLGVELMAASDNVLRGGLTPKHVDVPELLRVLDFSPVAVPYLEPTSGGPGVSVYRPDVPDFELVHVFGDDLDVQLELPGAAIALCVGGAVALTGSGAPYELDRGQAVYLDAAETSVRVTGAGELFVAAPGVAAPVTST